MSDVGLQDLPMSPGLGNTGHSMGRGNFLADIKCAVNIFKLYLTETATSRLAAYILQQGGGCDIV